MLGMQLRNKDSEVLGWLNRRNEPVVARLPKEKWTIGIDSDNADETATLTPRSVAVLVRSVQTA
ncbi:MAG: hypothetical protein MO846_04590 [Candidatus Devosia symbiotica]|nr:hypothetical protein [Candidatus Devosia symbiotica]